MTSLTLMSACSRAVQMSFSTASSSLSSMVSALVMFASALAMVLPSSLSTMAAAAAAAAAPGYLGAALSLPGRLPLASCRRSHLPA